MLGAARERLCRAAHAGHRRAGIRRSTRRWISWSCSGRRPDTRITWATRSGGIERVLGGGLNDELPGRGELGLRAVEALRSGRADFRSPFTAERIAAEGDALKVHGTEDGRPVELTVDRIVVATGFRPDLAMLSELRLSLDPVVEATPALAPLIDPNLHSCGTVRPHGVVELSHPEKDFYIVGMKSYGRAPTFLMTTGYEQVRSVVAEMAGDRAAAREVRLKLPETGVCRTAAAPKAAKSCCGAPAAETVVSAVPATHGFGLLRRRAEGGCLRLLRRRRDVEGRGQARLRLRRPGEGRAHDMRLSEQTRTVSALGVVEIFAWGSTYYLMAVLAGPLAADTGWSAGLISAGVSVGLLVSGLAAPRSGGSSRPPAAGRCWRRACS